MTVSSVAANHHSLENIPHHIPESLSQEKEKAKEAFKKSVSERIHEKLGPPQISVRLMSDNLPDIVRQLRDQLLDEFLKNAEEVEGTAPESASWKEAFLNLFNWFGNSNASSRTFSDEEANKILGSIPFLRKLTSLPSYQKALELFPNIPTMIESVTEDHIPKIISGLKKLTTEKLEEMLEEDSKYFDALTSEILENPYIFLPPDTSSGLNYTTAVKYIQSKASQDVLLYESGRIESGSPIPNPFTNKEITHLIPSPKKNEIQLDLCFYKYDVTRQIIHFLQSNYDEKDHAVEINGLKLIGLEQQVEGRKILKKYLKELDCQILIENLIQQVYLEKIQNDKDSTDLLTVNHPNVAEKIKKLKNKLEQILIQDYACFIDKVLLQKVLKSFEAQTEALSPKLQATRLN
ncbi:MAG: hypothetical protein Tsb0015_14740 [Simkaniaceae bacterium]